MKRSTKTENKEHKVEYVVKVLNATEWEDGGVTFSIDVNGVKIYGCRVVEGQKDGKDYEFISLPSYPSKKDPKKYYNHAWFPISKELQEDIIKQIEKILDA